MKILCAYCGGNIPSAAISLDPLYHDEKARRMCKKCWSAVYQKGEKRKPLKQEGE